MSSSSGHRPSRQSSRQSFRRSPGQPSGEQAGDAAGKPPRSRSRTGARAPAALDRTVTHRLHTLSKLTDRVSRAAYESDAGIPHSEGRCLAAIGAFSPLSVNDLAQRANLDKGQASRAAQSLVDQGLVLKQASATDGRGVVLTPTAKGERVWQRVMQVIERRNAEIVACLDAAEARQFSLMLDRLVEHARSSGGGGGTDEVDG